MEILIKEEHKASVVGFNSSIVPLGKRSQSDLKDLATLANHRPNLAIYFEALPSLKELQNDAGESFLEKTKAPEIADKKTS